MKETIGQVFSISRDNKPLPFLTISKEISDGIIYFSLAKNTDISAEIYSNHKLLIVVDGNMEVYISNKQSFHLTTLEMIVTDTNIPIGISTQLYLLIPIREPIIFPAGRKPTFTPVRNITRPI